jgi:hypothetical protein
LCQNFHSLATLEARFKARLEACFTDKNFSRERLSCAWEQNRPTACSAGMHDRARLLLSAVTRRNGLAILENPSTSMTQHMLALCEFGTNWAKTWCFVSDKPDIELWPSFALMDPRLTNLLWVSDWLMEHSCHASLPSTHQP